MPGRPSMGPSPWLRRRRSRSAWSGLSVSTAPPSPPDVITFCSKRLTQARSPKPPMGRPPISVPSACAASSTTGTPASAATAVRAAMSAATPLMWTTTMALVRSVISDFTESGSRQWVSGVTSAKTGRAPRYTTGLAEPMKVWAGTMTSSPGPTSRTCSARCTAAVPVDTATACSTRWPAARAASNSWTVLLPCPTRRLERRAATAASMSSSVSWGHRGNSWKELKV